MRDYRTFFPAPPRPYKQGNRDWTVTTPPDTAAPRSQGARLGE